MIGLIKMARLTQGARKDIFVVPLPVMPRTCTHEMLCRSNTEPYGARAASKNTKLGSALELNMPFSAIHSSFCPQSSRVAVLD